MGEKYRGQQRTIIARLPDSQVRSKIFKSAGQRLRGTKYFITSQMTPSCDERKKFLLPEFKAKRNDPANRAIIRKDKLYIKNQLQRQFLNPTLPNVADSASDDVTMVSQSVVKSEGGSCFRGYAAPATSIDEVARLRKFLAHRKLEVSSASHIVYAYRVTGPDGRVTENFDSDRDWNCGLELLKMMQLNNLTDTFCLATRRCDPDYVYIGKRRFELMKSLCLQAHGNLGELGEQ